jgi:putative ABC transport system ATP-binding protein
LDNPSAGSVRIDGEEITSLTERKLTELRNRKIGFVFQQFHLVPTLTAIENVMLPIQFSAVKSSGKAETRAGELLKELGLGSRLRSLPKQLSGGEQQRVAIARALANHPPLLLADEPTGNLDSKNSEIVLNALQQVRKSFGVTIVMVTHNPAISATLDRTIVMKDGLVESDSKRGDA